MKPSIKTEGREGHFKEAVDFPPSFDRRQGLQSRSKPILLGKSSSVSEECLMEEDFEAGSQMERGFRVSPLFHCQSTRNQKRCSGEGTSSSRGEAALCNPHFEEDKEVENLEVCMSSPSQSPESFSNPSCGLTLPLPNPSGPDLLSSVSHSQSPMENRAQFASSNQLSESVNPSKSKPILPKEVSNLDTVSQSGEFQTDGLSPRKMDKVRDVLSSLDIKVYSRRKSRCSTENPDVVMIQETKKVECDKRFVGSVWTIRNKEWAALPACGASGGILIIWDSKKLRSEEVVIGSFLVSVKFALDGYGPLWLSAIYGPNSPLLRKDFWVELLNIFCLSFPLWCVGDDFNVIRRSSKKLGGSSLTSSIKDFDGFIRECELLDPPLRNASFTWSNMQESPVCKRLDCFLYSNEWGQFFPQSLQEALPRRTSDHWPIVLDTNPFKWAPTPFRFENMWLQHPNFKESFRSWWRGFQRNEWEGHKFMRRLQFVKANLKEWNKVLENESGLVLNNSESITKEILLYFEKLYASPIGESWSVEGLDRFPISEESASRLDSLFTKEEISKAIFQLDRDKASRPDGFTIIVFQDCWDVIKEDLVRVFVEFHISGIINQSINASFIVLLPKKSLTKKISDFKPISLITSLYKIIAKMLSRRLRGVLHETIHSTQGTFVQGRQIVDVVLIANEIVDEKRRLGEEGVVLKIDFEKAYDHMKWVKASRGLRQGDPLSPFLFTLVADVLSRMLLRAEERNLLKGFRVGRNRTRASHLQFADYTIFFSNTRKEELHTLKSLLLVFEHISRLKVNLDKSIIYGINLDQNHISRLAELLECKTSGWPILYLGLSLKGIPRLVAFGIQ
ncbi:Transposon TX1 uncharacterized 149 kDa protein [Vitis vinifera]|uniref:Transposon TX1 uncharacterized 149 kDa protein n=1 Tax=Vitis vinifera TaxID=29760 RepID=A0A438BVZ4_VITVI|nr:Transposon TX1 uncharacterized 149 kDa protein [Vitis vinifera]